jgi:regulator of nonsense transcripts 1
MVRGANVRQLVIDEGGMCMEPECLVPLRAFKAVKQVVVIGDHRQLQPIVMDSVAKDRGLDISLFERYKDRAIMLTHQYRMVGI